CSPQTRRPQELSLCCNHPRQAFQVEGSEPLKRRPSRYSQALLVERTCRGMVTLEGYHLCQVGECPGSAIPNVEFVLCLEVRQALLEERVCRSHLPLLEGYLS